MGFPGRSVVKNLPTSVGDASLIPGLGRSPGEGNSNPLQYSCLENPMDREAWWSVVHGVAKSWTWLSNCTCTLIPGKYNWISKVMQLYIHIYVCVWIDTLFHYRLLQGIEYSFLCYSIDPHYLFYTCTMFLKWTSNYTPIKINEKEMNKWTNWLIID